MYSVERVQSATIRGGGARTRNTVKYAYTCTVRVQSTKNPL